MRPATKPKLPGGFTLVEMIVSIVIGGILIALVGMFGRWQIQSYFDISSRAALTDAADTALRRMARDLQSALPNSVRVSGNYLEFIPIRTAGRYRAESGGGADFPLDFGVSATASRFEVLGPTVNIAGGEDVVIYNLGFDTADAYAGGNRRTPVAGTGLSQVRSVSGAAFGFPLASPGSRFQVVGQPVTYECDSANGVIRRYGGYGFHPVQPTSGFGVTPAVLVDNVSRAAGCAFHYTAPGGALQRNGLVSLRLTLEANGETVTLMHQVEILNAP